MKIKPISTQTFGINNDRRTNIKVISTNTTGRLTALRNRFTDSFYSSKKG